MALTLLEQRILRGKLLSLLDGAYPHHVDRDILDGALDQLNFWKGDTATLQEIVWLEQSGYLTWETEPDSQRPRENTYVYQLTAKGHSLVSRAISDPEIMWFAARKI